MVRISYKSIVNSYDQIKQSAYGRQACSILIMVSYEVDAMCSARMLTQLLRTDNIAYTIRPVLNITEAIHSYKSHLTDDIKTIIMINCGALYNIPKLFDLEQGGDVRCFIVDNHRPVHLANLYSKHNVVLFDDEQILNEEQNVPSDGSELSSAIEDSTSDEDSEEEEEEMEEEDEELGSGGEEKKDDIDAVFDEDEEEADGVDPGDEDADPRDEEVDPGDGDIELGDVDSEDLADDEDDGGNEDMESVDPGDEEKSLGSHAEKLDRTIHYDEEGEEVEKPKKKSTKTSADKVKSSKTLESETEVPTELDRTVVEDWQQDNEENEEINEEQNDEEEEEDDDEEVVVVGRKRKGFAEMRRVAKMRKASLQNYYKQHTRYASPTSLMILTLVGGKYFGRNTGVPLDAIWQSILGVTDQYQRGNIQENEYEEICAFLKGKISTRLDEDSQKIQYSVTMAPPLTANPNPTGTEEVQPNNPLEITVSGSERGHIEQSSEYRFFLYRHWALFDSLGHSPYVAAKLGVWGSYSSRGAPKLEELLAKMGIPLQQCRQKFQFMNPALRDHFRKELQNPALLEHYGLTNPGVTVKSFTRFYSFKNPISAFDAVYAATALLEMYGSNTSKNAEKTKENDENFDPDVLNLLVEGENKNSVTPALLGFHQAFECIGSTRNLEVVQKGLLTALDLQRTIVRKARALLDGSDSILRFSRLYYAYLSHMGVSSTTKKTQDVNPNLELEGENSFGRPMVVARLGRYIMDVKRHLPRKDGGWQGSALLPLILLSEKKNSMFLVVAISPLICQSGGPELSEDQERKLYPLTNFRQFFKLAAQDLHLEVKHVSFDCDVVEIARKDTHDFLGALDYFLKKASPHFNK